MSEVKRLSLDLEYPFQYTEDAEGNLCYYADYAALKQKLDAVLAKGMELAQEAAHVYAEYNKEMAPDVVCDGQTIQEFYDLANRWVSVDAYLNSVRAEVIKDFCQLVGQYGKVEPHHFNSDFADLYAKINKEIYESILDNPAVYDMESLVDWLESGVNDSRAYADMSIQHAAQLRAGEPS